MDADEDNGLGGVGLVDDDGLGGVGLVLKAGETPRCGKSSNAI